MLYTVYDHVIESSGNDVPWGTIRKDPFRNLSYHLFSTH